MAMSRLTDIIARILAEECAEGRPVFEIPAQMLRSGPCPRCRATVETANVTFEAQMSSEGLTSLLPKSDEYPARGLIVCHACLTPLMFTQKSSAYEIVPKKVLKRLPEVSRRFIARHQEMYRRNRAQR